MTTNNLIKQLARQMAKKATFVRGNYQVAVECSLEEFTREFDSRYLNIDVNKPAEVISCMFDNGDIINNVLFHTTNNADLEMRLSKKSNLEEGDEIDITTIKFMFLTKLDKGFWVCDGDIYVEPKPKATKKTTKKKLSL